MHSLGVHGLWISVSDPGPSPRRHDSRCYGADNYNIPSSNSAVYL
jgi:hypothetical protein